MKIDYPTRLGADAIAQSLGYEQAVIVETTKNRFKIDFGNNNFSHTNGVPASQLVQWVSGAVSVLHIAQKQLEDIETKRKEALQAVIPEGDDLIDALVKEYEGDILGAENTKRIFPFLDADGVTFDDVKNLAENVDSDLRVLTQEELDDIIYDETQDAICETGIYKIAVRIAYYHDTTLLNDDLTNLRHELSKAHNVYHPYLI